LNGCLNDSRFRAYQFGRTLHFLIFDVLFNSEAARMDAGVSKLDLQSRANKFEAHASKQLEKEYRKAEKERILQERASARKAAHERAVQEVRRRQAEDAEQVDCPCHLKVAQSKKVYKCLVNICFDLRSS
jgi:uncharacterized protein YaiL (DUF2058 family)